MTLIHYQKGNVGFKEVYIEWRWHFSQKREQEKESMASEKEWVQLMVEKF